jgi:GNAT superfamily N-acetyltransferase
VAASLREESLERIRRVWGELAGAPAAFREPGCTVSAWASRDETARVSIVQLGHATAVTVPQAQVGRFSDLVARYPGRDLTDPSAVVELVGAVPRSLGPATLAYADDGCFQPRTSPAVRVLPARHDAVLDLVAECGSQDAAESGLDRLGSPLSTIERDGKVVAACGYETWLATLAHIGVLTHPRWRRQGLATLTASSSVTHALEAGLIPQWRARHTLTGSRRTARSLGFVELGGQLTFWLA